MRRDRSGRSTWEANPVFMRELRSRWRSWRLLVWPAAGVLFSAVALGWVVTTRRYLRAEEALVWAVTGAQMALVVAGAPALAAGGMATERRNGNLDMMRITRLSVHQIVLGKALSSLHPLALSFFCQLPLFVYIAQARPIGLEPLAAYVLALEVAALLACAGIGVAAMTEASTRLQVFGVYAIAMFAPCWLAVVAVSLMMKNSPLLGVGIAPLVLLLGAPVYVVTVDAVRKRFERD